MAGEVTTVDSTNAFAVVRSYADAAAGKAAIDPATIIAIIQAILTMVSQFCPKPPTPAQVKGEAGQDYDFVENLAIRQQGIAPRLAKGRAIKAAIAEQRAAMSDADAEAVAALCQ